MFGDYKSDLALVGVLYVKVITPYECYIRFIITEHECRRPEGKVIIILI